MSIQEKLLKMQLEMKAPKDKYNDFSHFKYRSAESVLENLKPLLEKHKCLLELKDSIELIGTRYYVKTLAILTDLESDSQECIKCEGYAREEETKKGMDCMQITGACSSYSMKYCLNKLFLIDDANNEIDSKDNTKQEGKVAMATETQIEIIKTGAKVISNDLKELGISKPSELKKLTMEQASNLCQKLKKLSS